MCEIWRRIYVTEHARGCLVLLCMIDMTLTTLFLVSNGSLTKLVMVHMCRSVVAAGEGVPSTYNWIMRSLKGVETELDTPW